MSFTERFEMMDKALRVLAGKIYKAKKALLDCDALERCYERMTNVAQDFYTANWIESVGV